MGTMIRPSWIELNPQGKKYKLASRKTHQFWWFLVRVRQEIRRIVHTVPIIQILVDEGIISSLGEAKRLIKQGGIKIYNEDDSYRKMTDPNEKLIDNKSPIVIRVGKHQWRKLIFEDGK